MWRHFAFFFFFLTFLMNLLILWYTYNLDNFIKNNEYIRVWGEKVYKEDLTKLLNSEENKIAQRETMKNSLEEIKWYFANKAKQGSPVFQSDKPGANQADKPGANNENKKDSFFPYLREWSFKPDELSAFKERNWIKGDEIVMLEYSDFNCKYCKKQNEEKIIEKVLSRYAWNSNPNQKRVRRIFKPYTQDTVSAKNVMCLIDANPEKIQDILDAGFKWHMNKTDEVKKTINTHKLKNNIEECDLKKTEDILNLAIQEWTGLFMVQWTPTTILLNPTTGKYYAVEGAMPLEAFIEWIEAL